MITKYYQYRRLFCFWENMKVTILSGTPRENGYTSEVIKNLIPGLESVGCDVNVVTLFDKEISGCSNCGVCEQEGNDGECAIDDDMDDIYPIIKESELLIIASPIYMWQFTACTKAFLERLHCMYDSMSGKKVALVMTMGDDEFVGSYAVAGMLDMCEYYHMIYQSSFAVPYADKDEVNRPLYLEKMKDFIQRITG